MISELAKKISQKIFHARDFLFIRGHLGNALRRFSNFMNSPSGNSARADERLVTYSRHSVSGGNNSASTYGLTSRHNQRSPVIASRKEMIALGTRPGAAKNGRA